MTPALRIIFLFFLLINSENILAKPSNKIQAEHALKLWSETCLDYSANYQTLSLWARANNLRRANRAFSEQALQGGTGEVWKLSKKQGDFFLVLSKPNVCAVWAPTADSDRINHLFKDLMKSSELEKDRVVKGQGGEYRQIAYFKPEDSSYGWVFIATTAISEDIWMQARLTMSKGASLTGTAP